MQICLIDINHPEQKVYIEFQGETINANITFTRSELGVLDRLILKIDRMFNQEVIRICQENHKSDAAKTVEKSSNKNTSKNASAADNDQKDRSASQGR